jgi:two-component system chemotaxis response regulator CheB
MARVFDMVVIGTSSGGMQAMKRLLTALPGDFSLAIAVVQHITASADDTWASIMNDQCALMVKEADEKERIRAATVYLAPANYHLLIEPDHTFTLTVDEHVNYARPAIDVLFETAAQALGPRLIGIVMTGANTDGADGLRVIKDRGGLTIVQDPDTAAARPMPEAAIRTADPDYILPIDGISAMLLKIHNDKGRLLS